LKSNPQPHPKPKSGKEGVSDEKIYFKPLKKINTDMMLELEATWVDFRDHESE
jgi:hypothetical protein